VIRIRERVVVGLVLLGAVPALPGLAEESEPVVAVPGEAFVNANAAYEAGDFGRAIALYEGLLERGFETGHLHYDLGNAYLRGGELGRAIASYRRSQAFLPRDQDVAANLAFARKSARDAIRPPEPGAVARTLFFWHYGLSRAELATVFAVVNLLLWTVLVLRLYRRGSELLRWTLMALAIVLVAVGASLAVHHLWTPAVAVIVPQEIDVRSGTHERDVVLFKLHAGTEVRLVDRREGALRIALPEEGQGGWIDAEHAEVVVR
jgi:tetratricopeptide (TPR) repeat protein